MTFRFAFVVLTLLAVTACGPDVELANPVSADESDISRSALDAHYEARHCEVFIDKIAPYQGSHALRAANVWVKVLPQRLDGAVAEVGFRYSLNGGNWFNYPLGTFEGANDYYVMNLHLSSFDDNTYRGAYYVKTNKGTYYWAKALTGQDFIFDKRTHDVVASIGGGGVRTEGFIDRAVSTQRAGMEYYNVNRCR